MDDEEIAFFKRQVWGSQANADGLVVIRTGGEDDVPVCEVTALVRVFNHLGCVLASGGLQG